MQSEFERVAGTFDAEGRASWAPVRPADFDADLWGPWECWEQCEIGPLPKANPDDPECIGAVKTGHWVAWDSVGNDSILCQDRVTAEAIAVVKNDGAATRVVFADGTAEKSGLDLEEAKALPHPVD